MGGMQKHEQPYGGKESMNNMHKTNFKSLIGSHEALPENNLRIQSNDEFDYKTFISLHRSTVYNISKTKMIQSKKYQIGRTNYIVNSCFELEHQNTADSGIEYLLKMKLQDGKVS